MSKTTKAVTKLRRRYTRIAKFGGRWKTFLQIDHQGFCVVEDTTKAQAEWYAKMLAIALARMIEDSKKEAL